MHTWRRVPIGPQALAAHAVVSLSWAVSLHKQDDPHPRARYQSIPSLKQTEALLESDANHVSAKQKGDDRDRTIVEGSPSGQSFRAACSIPLRIVYHTWAVGQQGKVTVIPRISFPVQGDPVSWWNSSKGASQSKWRTSTGFSQGSPHRSMPWLVIGGWSPHIWNHRWFWKAFFNPHSSFASRYSAMTQMGWGGEDVGGRSKTEEIYVYKQLIHFVVQQKLMQHHKAIIFQHFF